MRKPEPSHTSLVTRELDWTTASGKRLNGLQFSLDGINKGDQFLLRYERCASRRCLKAFFKCGIQMRQVVADDGGRGLVENNVALITRRHSGGGDSR